MTGTTKPGEHGIPPTDQAKVGAELAAIFAAQRKGE